jgi:hypothetical protein
MIPEISERYKRGRCLAPEPSDTDHQDTTATIQSPAIHDLKPLKMLFKSTSLVLASATCLLASPLNQEHIVPNSYVELYREPAAHSNGSLVYLGHAPGAAPGAQLESRATCHGNVAPTCSGKYAARNDICESLVNELFADSRIGVAQSPRQICYEGAAAESNDYCCVSWHNVVPSLTKGDLGPIANTMLQTCTSNGISGKTYNTWVRQTCTSVCLSNRGTGC